MGGLHARRVGRRGTAAATAAFVVSLAVLGVQDVAFADDGMHYALILDDAGLVINVSVFHPVDSQGWLEAMRQQGANVIVREHNDVGIGSVLQPDGSFARDVPPPPPAALPTPEGDAGWTHQPGVEEPRKPQIADPNLRRFLGVPGPEDGVNRIALHIGPDGVVKNASVYNTVTSVGWLELMRERGEHIVIADRGGIGWSLLPDGSVAPPKPRPGMVWNGSEWRDPGTEAVERPKDVRGWALDRVEPIVPRSADDLGDAADGAVIADLSAGVYGRLLVPEDAVDEDSTTAEIAERSIVMLESYGDTVPFLARFDGLTQLPERLDRELDAALAAHEQVTGEPIEESVAEGFRGAARRLAASFLSLFGMDTTAWIRGLA